MKAGLFRAIQIIAFFGGIALLRADTPPEISQSLAIIRAVGPEGQGNAEASAAWKTISVLDASAIPTILEAMDGANDFSINWLRSAVDTIASRSKSKLPLGLLGKFIIETHHHPHARRLAYELLARDDPGTAERLLTGMLNDSSLEIRRDAVQKLVGSANKSLSSSNVTGAAVLYQQALAYARDVQQIELISKKLNEIGQPVDLVKLFGFITQWKIVGPFDNTGGKGFELVFPPEEKIDLNAVLKGKTGSVTWTNFVSSHKYGMVDMNQPYGKLKEVTAYATADFFSDKSQSVELRLGGKNSWKLWLNGKLLFARDEYHADAEIDQYRMPAQLQPGRNTILVKVCQNELVEEWTEEWEFQLRVTDSLGTPIFSSVLPGDVKREAKSLSNEP